MRSLRAGRDDGLVALLPIVLLEPPVALGEEVEPLVDGLALELELVDGLVVELDDELLLDGLVLELLLDGLVVELDEPLVDGLMLELPLGLVVELLLDGLVVELDEPLVDGLVVELLDDGAEAESLLLDGLVVDDDEPLVDGLVLELEPLVDGLVVELDELPEDEVLESVLEPVLLLVLGDVVDDEPVAPVLLGLLVPPVPMPGAEAPAPGGVVLVLPLVLPVLWA